MAKNTVILFLLFFPLPSLSFLPEQILKAKILGAISCYKEETCILVEEDSKKFLVIGKAVDKKFVFNKIFLIDKDKLLLIWSWDWKEV